MFYPPNIPWLQIHEFILEIGNERRPLAFFQKALAGIGRLIPCDSVQVLLIEDVGGKLQSIHNNDQDLKSQPSDFYRISNDNSFQITHQEVLNIPKRYRETYPYYFKRTDLSVAITPHNPMIFNTSRNVYRQYAFASEWLKPLEMEYSAGMKFMNPKLKKVTLFLLYRSQCQVGFNDLEIAVLDILQAHLANLLTNIEHQTGLCSTRDIALKVRDFHQLTEREREIVTLICQGASTSCLSSKLFIAPSTVYRHINNVFEKLNVSNRQELVAAILGIDNQDKEERLELTVAR